MNGVIAVEDDGDSEERDADAFLNSDFAGTSSTSISSPFLRISSNYKIIFH